MKKIQYNAQTDSVGWEEQLSHLPPESNDFYFYPDYHLLHVLNNDGIGVFNVFEEGGSKLMIPGLQMKIEGNLTDLQTCNGYGGPVASSDATGDFLECAWEEWRQSSARSGIVAGFFRLHPLIGNQRWLPADAKVVMDRQTVSIDLSEGLEAAWQRATSRHRNMVNKGRREGIEVQWNDPDGWPAFEKLYGASMERVNSPSSLRFSPAYFEKLRHLPGVELASVRIHDKLQAASVFLFGKLWAHYHLSVRCPDSDNYLTNLILQSAVQKSVEYGLRGLHLGGGRTRASEDSLLKFKLSLGGDLLDFNVALVIADPINYSNLCRHWENLSRLKQQWLLGYRQPIS
jgi:hypothetical protein